MARRKRDENHSPQKIIKCRIQREMRRKDIQFWTPKRQG
jgi:hypothetical protein